MVTGPTEDQVKILKTLNVDISLFKDQPRGDISAFLSREIGETLSAGEKQQIRALQSRKDAIRKKQLTVGKRIQVTSGPNKGKEGIIEEITDESYLLLDIQLRGNLPPISVELL